MTGPGPAVWFDTAITDGSLDENYSSGQYGANDVLAYTGSGAGRDTAQAVAADFHGRPRLQRRFSPSLAVASHADLIGHAVKALAELSDGTNTVSFVVDLATGPRLGVDWFVGDDCGYELVGPAFPDAPTGVTRVVGYSCDAVSVTPSLAVPAVL